MKRIITILLCAVMLFCFVACSSDVNETTNEVHSEDNVAEEKQEKDTETVHEKDSEENDDTNVEVENDDEFLPDITFTTTDIDGVVFTEQAFKGQKLTMVNFWAPWCGPCVSEMPDLNRIYEEYNEEGLIIWGVFGADSNSSDEEVRESVANTGVTYPIIRYCDEFSPLMTDYFPTTVFIDKNGKICSEPIIGSKSYEEWVEIIEDLL